MVNHFVRRSFQEATTQQWHQTSEDNIKTYQLPAWGLAMLSITGLVYVLVVAAVRSFLFH